MRQSLANAALIATLYLTGCINVGRFPVVEGSGHTAVETRDVTAFDRLSVAGSGELTLIQGDEESLTVEADDNLLQYIGAEVKGGRLLIGPENVSIRQAQPIRYRLHFKNLRELDLAGSVKAAAPELKTDRFEMHISGAGRMEVGRLTAETLAAHISGAGRTTAAGDVHRQEIRISGSGNHYAPELKSEEADADISGSGKASLWVTEALHADISGSGRVEYRGTPRVDYHVSGSGRVRRMEAPE